MFYCRYGQMSSDDKGLYMICPKDCGCTQRELQREQEYDRDLIPGWVYFTLGFIIVGLVYGVYLLSTVKQWLGP